MKLIIKSAMSLSVIAIMAIFMSGCVEHRYYRDHHDHSPEWHHRHHSEPRVDVNIHN
jgi:hypothetical protein